MDQNKLIDLAWKARENAYVPYSHFKVGACIALKDGTFVQGCNIENAAYGSTMCAERNAVFGAYCKGYRKEDIIGLAIVADCSPIASPCGACRQVLSELVDLEMPIFLANKEKVEKHTIGELLPMVFIGESFKSGFVSIVGRPNVGKSTLLNQILKTKLAIMSDVAQTTRNTIQGIYTDNEAQIIFMDTPGIHKPQDGLGNFMNTTALNSIYGVDMVLFIAPANETIGRGDRFIIERLKEADGPVFLLLNKCDLVSKDEVIKKLTEWKELFDFKEIIPISALEDQNVDTLISTIKTYLNEGMMYYPKDQMTDHPERFVMAEFIREKILYFTREEVPHSVAIVVERMAELEDGSVEVIATIVVDRKSQKGILIGKQGSMIKKIRQNAQREMKRFLQTTVHLELFVKVENNWRNKQKYLKEFGYNEDDY